MWLISCKFVGDKGTYTKHEENATDKGLAQKQYTRMLEVWHNIIVKPRFLTNLRQYYDTDAENEHLTETRINQIRLHQIEAELDLLNIIKGSDSTFEIEMCEIDDDESDDESVINYMKNGKMRKLNEYI